VGTIHFVFLHIMFLGGWALWNTGMPEYLRFDPYPFTLLGGTVSSEGVLLAIFILINQNRLISQTDRRDHLALQVSILSEQELTTLLRMVRRLCHHAGIQVESEDDQRTEGLMKDTNVHELMRQVEKEIPQE
jgi:uncharacterized membrane protein